jgi:hypothetical protein
MAVSWDTAPCSLVDGIDRRFGVFSCLHPLPLLETVISGNNNSFTSDIPAKQILCCSFVKRQFAGFHDILSEVSKMLE